MVKEGMEAYGDKHPRMGFTGSANDIPELTEYLTQSGEYDDVLYRMLALYSSKNTGTAGSMSSFVINSRLSDGVKASAVLTI